MSFDILEINLKEDKNTTTIEEILALVQKNGALEHTKQFAEAYVAIAKKYLEILPPSNYRDALAELADFSLHRNT